ncbi:MAG: FAD:protein FMN transferase [Chloroflexi bacterium]|nr:FAD:protein FMN transferase [Chloroflexota bacterium]
MQYPLKELMFRAMNTDVKVSAVGCTNSRDLDAVRNLFIDTEERFSRFIETSELSRLNREGLLNPASAPMIDVLQRSLLYSKTTGLVFNPAILSALESSGYSSSFETLDLNASGTLDLNTPIPALSDVLDIDLDIKRVQTTTRLDLGGVVKGWTVDRAAEHLRLRSRGWLIDAGGDISVGGEPPDIDGWVVGIDNPFVNGELADVIRIEAGGIATSSVVKRSWSKNSHRRHHIIDPAVGKSTSSGLAAATVVAESTELAEVLAKSVIVMGEQAGFNLIKRNAGQARFTRTDASTVATDGWPSLAISTNGNNCLWKAM